MKITTTFTLFLGASPVASVEGTKLAYDAWAKFRDFAEVLGVRASLVYNEDGEVLAEYDPEEDLGDEPADIDDDCGFDPYEGCYTWDC
jgi:hypothetical protein